MQIYLPIAEISVGLFALLGVGGLVGFLSGMFGVGGGFLITPLLFFLGVPPTVAVATGANQVVASSVSAVLSHIRRRTVDFRMGWVLLAGGLIGSSLGIFVFNLLSRLGQIDLAVQLSYVLFLGLVGLIMFQESMRAILRSRSQPGKVPKRHQHLWVHRWPLKMKFRASGLYISVIPPLMVGALVGVLAAVMGVGGGFIMVPAMIYLLGMPTKVVVGTSLFQIIFVSAYTTMMHAITNGTVDIMLALALIVGGVIGAQFGAQAGARLKAEQVRILLALIVLGVAATLATGLLLRPDELYSISSEGHA
ncbi:sulfite exporter TauE/SafE family protein [Frigidibacter oleivorans]|uniref:sulfite exporter TauE/SafE family protein n=1 Tax=Frigidibacter oleivorans TaxID=2487129 RepID=UPI000F8E725B|nr:sulfite exporter TauE/SafE family protein [Frigidibacter oleivorans]